MANCFGAFDIEQKSLIELGMVEHWVVSVQGRRACMPTVRRFWIEFDTDHESVFWWGRPYAGVTGFDERDCLAMVADLISSYEELPPVRRITADISLPQDLPVKSLTLGVTVWRGVWYPPLNLRIGPTWRPSGVGRAINPSYEPTTASELLHTNNRWWDEIPHINRLLFPLVHLHSAVPADQMRQYAPKVRGHVARDSAFRDRMREALDYMIARHPTPDEWYDPTRVWFLDQQELNEYLGAFRDYLFGNRPEPIYPPTRNRPASDGEPGGGARDSGGPNVL